MTVWSEVLEMVENKEDSWFDGLEEDYPNVKWMPRVPRVDYTQSPRVDGCCA